MIPNNNILFGLLPADQKTIQYRQFIVRQYLQAWLPVDHPCYIAVAAGEVPTDLRAWFTELERTVMRYTALAQVPPDHAGLHNWHAKYMLPLASELGFIEQAQEIRIRTCWRRGLFDVPDQRGKRLRPIFDAILAPVQSVLADAPHTTSRHRAQSRVAQFVDRNLCQNTECAEQVAEELRPSAVERDAAAMARGLLVAYLQYPPLGLLAHSHCPYFRALLFLAQQRCSVASGDDLPEVIWATLQADLVAFCVAAQRVNPSLWNERLLHEPPNTPTRQHYQRKHLWHNQRTRFLAAIAQQRGCGEDDAIRLLDSLVQQGLPALIDWRRGDSPTSTRATWQQRHLTQRLERHLIALDPEDRRSIEVMFHHLVAAMQETGVPLPLAALIDEYPSSPRRRRISRRFWFGLSTILQHREARRHQRWRVQRSRFIRTPRPKQWSVTADTLVAAFAQRSDIDEPDARTLLRDFITYGLFGLLPRAVRVNASHEPLVSWLALIRWGKLPGSVPWTAVMQQLRSYAQELSLPPLSPQVARAIFNSIPKPAYWHGGQGAAVERVRQRASVNVDKLPRLHKTWLLAPIQMPISRHNGSPQVWHGVLVFDRESELLMGVCCSEQPPSTREVNLAIHDAIWHPTELNWPLHGLPECIQVPQELVAQGLHDLDRAAAFLLTKIDTHLKKPWLGLKVVRQVMTDIQKRWCPVIGAMWNGNDRLNAVQLAQHLLRWYKQMFLPDHTAARVPLSIRKHGVTMPGYDTPAAGWLLPMTDTVQITNNAVILHGVRYRSSWLGTHEGQTVPCRTYPFYIPTAEQNVDESSGYMFVNVGEGEESRIYCLTT